MVDESNTITMRHPLIARGEEVEVTYFLPLYRDIEILGISRTIDDAAVPYTPTTMYAPIYGAIVDAVMGAN